MHENNNIKSENEKYEFHLEILKLVPVFENGGHFFKPDFKLKWKINEGPKFKFIHSTNISRYTNSVNDTNDRPVYFSTFF